MQDIVSQTGHSGDASTYRFDAFLASPPSTVVPSDLPPRDIEAAHKARVEAELSAILSRLS